MKKSTFENIGRTIDITYTLCRGRKISKRVAKKQGVASASQLVFIAIKERNV